MDITKLIKNNFNLVIDAYIQNEFGNKFLRVCVDETDLNRLAKISLEINKYIDEVDGDEETYFLDIFSPGTDQEFEINKSKEYIGQNIRVILKLQIKSMKIFEGKLIFADDNDLTIK